MLNMILYSVFLSNVEILNRSEGGLKVKGRRECFGILIYITWSFIVRVSRIRIVDKESINSYFYVVFYFKVDEKYHNIAFSPSAS